MATKLYEKIKNKILAQLILRRKIHNIDNLNLLYLIVKLLLHLIKENMPIHRYIIIAFILVLSQDYALSQNNQTEEIEEVIVIGSRLSDKNINNLLPATYIDSETIDLLGIDSGDELLRSIIQQGTNKFNDAGNAIAGVNSARGDIGAYSLRNLGTGNTLVLLNGRRMAKN